MITADERQNAIDHVQALKQALDIAPANDRLRIEMALLGAMEYLEAVEEEYRTAQALTRMPKRANTQS